MPDQWSLPEGYRLHFYDTIDSTNAEALRRIAAGAQHGDVFWATGQSCGRGRRDRTWYSPPGNLYVTFVVETPVGQPVGQLAFVAAIGAGDALGDGYVTPASLRYKWPNDLMMDGRKLGGILIEGDSTGRNSNLVALGLGLNITSSPPDQKSVSLLEAGFEANLNEILRDVCFSIERWYQIWRYDGFAAIRDRWLEAAYGIDGLLDVRFPDGTERQGIFRGIDQSGALILERQDGNTEFIATGEVFAGSA